MKPQTKTVIALHGASTTNAATASGVIDRLGYDHASIDVIMGAAAATEVPTVLKLQESDTTDASNYSDVSGFVGGTSFTIPAPHTSLAHAVRLEVDCKARKRYLKALVSPKTTVDVSIVARLMRGEEAPMDAAKAGVTALVVG